MQIPLKEGIGGESRPKDRVTLQIALLMEKIDWTSFESKLKLWNQVKLAQKGLRCSRAQKWVHMVAYLYKDKEAWRKTADEIRRIGRDKDQLGPMQSIHQLLKFYGCLSRSAFQNWRREMNIVCGGRWDEWNVIGKPALHIYWICRTNQNPKTHQCFYFQFCDVPKLLSMQKKIYPNLNIKEIWK